MGAGVTNINHHTHMSLYITLGGGDKGGKRMKKNRKFMGISILMYKQEHRNISNKRILHRKLSFLRSIRKKSKDFFLFSNTKEMT